MTFFSRTKNHWREGTIDITLFLFSSCALQPLRLWIVDLIPFIVFRYIEIFRSSLAELNAQTGPKIRPLMSEMVSRPSPYARGDRFGGPNRFSGRGPSLAPRSRGIIYVIS